MITLAAHALNRVVQCNGSVFMPEREAPQDDEQSDDRREGIAAHWLGLEVIAGRFGDSIELVDRKAPNGVWITPEMSEFVDPFIEDVRSRGVTPHVEETVDFALSPEVYISCRLDLATYDASTGTLTVDDFKYGFRLVEPFENWQLVAGAIGWIRKYGIKPNRIDLNVHQPRPHHADGKKRTWEFASYDAFVGHAEAVLTARIAHLERELRTGPSCYMCPALAHCEAARRASYNTIDAAGRVFDDRLPDDVLAFEFDNLEIAIKRAENLRDAMKELLTHRLQSGRVFQNHAIEQAFGNTRFKRNVTPAMISAVSGVKVDKLQKTVPLTPAQMIKATVPESIIKAFTERPPAGQRLVKKSAATRAAAMFKPPTEK